MLKRALILTGIGLAIFIVAILGVEFSGIAGPSQLTGHGWIAFGGAAFLSLLVSAGLFALVFFSARSGRDDISDLSSNTPSQNHERIG